MSSLSSKLRMRRTVVKGGGKLPDGSRSHRRSPAVNLIWTEEGKETIVYTSGATEGKLCWRGFSIEKFAHQAPSIRRGVKMFLFGTETGHLSGNLGREGTET
jgi:hypothetical protein